MSEFKVYVDPEAVAQAAADYLYLQIKACVTQKKICHVVLPGGSTPARCLELLSEKNLPWDDIHWYPSDERCYPVGHVERNDSMILEKLFSKQQVSQLSTPDSYVSKNFHPIPAEIGAERGAEQYSALLDTTGGMDIVILGMGEDGHTASLFPGNTALDKRQSAVPVHDAPKPPSDRISVGLNILKNADARIVIATGTNKKEVLKGVQDGEDLPVNRVMPDTWFIDEAAATKR